MHRAFEEDPLVSWLTRGRDRAREHYASFVVSKMSLPHDASWIDDAGRAAALWIPPGGRTSSLGEQLRLLPTIARVVGWRRLGEVARFSERLERDRPAEYWYLALLATEADLRGCGLGRAVMGPGLARAAEIPAVLETSAARNLHFYEGLGFRVTREVQIDAGPIVWTMQRG